MQLPDAASAIALGEGQQQDYYFVYHEWMDSRGGDILRDVTHVRIHSSIRAIKDDACDGRSR